MTVTNLLSPSAPEVQDVLQQEVGGENRYATHVRELLINSHAKPLALVTEVYNTLRNISGLEGTGLQLLKGGIWSVHYTELISKNHPIVYMSVTKERRSLVCKLYKTGAGDILTIGKVQNDTDGDIVPLMGEDCAFLEDFLGQIKPGIGLLYTE